MELEKLEVLLDINTERVQASMEKFLPQIESMMSRFEQISGRAMGKTEKNLDIEKGASNFSKQLDKMTELLEKTVSNFEKTSKQSGETIGGNFSSGIKKARPKVSKEIDFMIKEMNAKMGQAKAAQEKLAYLKSQRQSASSSRDSGKVVKYDEQIARTQAQMTKFESQAKEIANNIKYEFDAVPQSLDNIVQKMAQNEGQIEAMRKRIKTLKAEYQSQRKPVGSFSEGFEKYEDTPKSLKTSSEVEKQTAKMQKLINSNDKLQMEYSQTEDRANSLRKALARINNSLGQSAFQTGTASDGVTKTGTGLKQSERAISKYGGLFNRTSNSISHGFGGVGGKMKNSLGFVGKFGNLFSNSSNKVTAGNRNMMRSTNAFGQSMKYLLPSLVVYQLIGGAVRSLAKGLFSAMNTNEQFSSSLNQIKVNLMTAFYPIYTAIMPAINTFMSALSQLTGQFASFMAGLFGMSYQQAKTGASSLYDNVQALEDTGNSAEKAKEKVKTLQKSLLGFDQINKLDIADDDDNSETLSGSDPNKPGVDFGGTLGNYTTPKWMSDIKKLLQDFFRPFQEAWKNQGQKVIDAWKYALKEVMGLVKAIGQSFMKVWTNGTGQKFIENWLILLADVLNIIGDIAKAFRIAWQENNRGTTLIQTIFDTLNNILELLHVIALSFREAWNDGTGISIASNILDIFINIVKTVGNLANQLKKAWETGNLGTSIFKLILGIFDDLLTRINNVTKSTEIWSRTLDFTPLLNSIKRLLESIRPLSDKIGEGLEWFYNNVLLPLASFTIENVIPSFLDLLGSGLKVLTSIINALQPTFSWLWDSFLKPIAEWTGGIIIDVIKGLTSSLESVSDWINKNQKIVEGFAIVVGSIATAFGLVKGALVLYNAVAVISAGVTGTLGGAVALLTSPMTLIIAAIASVIAAGILLCKNWDKIKEAASKLGEWLSGKWDWIKSTTLEAWDSIKNWTSEKWNTVKDTIVSKAVEISKNISEKWGAVKKTTLESWDNIKSWTNEKWTSTKGTIILRSKEIYDNVKEKWNNVRSVTKIAWEAISNKISIQAENAKTKASNAFNNLKDGMSRSFGTMKSVASEAFDKISSWASSLGDRIGKGLRGGVQAVKNGASAIFNGMVGIVGNAVNGVLKGINWVLDKVGAGGSKLSLWQIPKYATGTGYHPGGLALVNDGLGTNYQEAYRTPDGQTGIFPAQRNLMVNLPKGTSVLSGPQTAQLYDVPAYSGGVGKWLKEKWNGAKEIASDIWSYATDPKKLLNSAISKFTNLSKAFEPSLSMAKGAVGTVAEGATKWFTDIFNKKYEEYQETQVSTHDGSLAGAGVYKYLYDVAQKTMNKFKGMTVTSGYRPGDPYYHGRHQAIDIAYPSSMNYSSTYFNPANWVYENFPSQVGYVITQGKVRDRSGMSGTGKSGQWVHWPDNDHYDHLHINGLLGAGEISTGGNSQGGNIVSQGSGVERWRGIVNQALKKLNIYSVDNANRTLFQMKTESNGNPNAINNWDINAVNGTPSKGLMQVIDPTFRAFALAPYNKNIYDPLSNILASMRYALSRYGSLANAYRGVGYENGGIVSQDGIYRIGEGNKKEMIIPLEKPQRAVELINQAIEYLGIGDDFDGTMVLPNAFDDLSINTAKSNFDKNETMTYSGGGMQDFTSTILNTLMNAITALGATPKQDKNGDIIINIGGKEFGRIAVKEINKYHQQLGYTELNI